MRNVLKVTGKMLACYAIWGVVAACQPVLVSEEAAQSCKVLRVAKDVSDLMVTGCTLAFIAPIMVVSDILKKEES